MGVRFALGGIRDARARDMSTLAPDQLDARAARELVNRLRRLHDGEAAVMAVAAKGAAVVPALQELLVEREPSGIYQPRCRAAKTLGLVGAFDVLGDFLRLERRFADPIEQSGEDAVVNAAARALTRRKSEADFELLRAIAGKHAYLTGAVEALGSFGRADAVPELGAALGEDHSRFAAEAALAAIGKPAIATLVEIALRAPPAGELEYDRDARHRRSALRVLAKIGVPAPIWPRLRTLIGDEDSWVATLACGIALTGRGRADGTAARRRLAQLRNSQDVWLRMHIEDLLEPRRKGAGDRAGSAEDDW